MRILYLEDEQELSDLVAEFLRKDFDVDHVNNLDDIKNLLSLYHYQVAIIDRNLHGQDEGLMAIPWLREHNSAISIIVTSSYSTIDNKIEGLEAGADDYLEKPFDPRELNARIIANIRKTIPETLQSNDITFKMNSKQIWYENQQVFLSQKENDLLFFLLENPNQLFSPLQLIYSIYEHPDDVLPNTITATVKNIRKKLPHDMIRTIKTRGYMIEI